MIPGSRRLRSLSESFYLAQGERIAQRRRQGLDVWRLDIGSPDLPPPPEVIQCLTESAAQDHTHGYQAHTGPPALRQAWADAYQRWFDVSLSPETNLQPLTGSKEGIFNLTQALVDPGQVVLIPDPAYPTYAESARFAGAEIRLMPLQQENRYLPDLSRLKEKDLRRTRLLWLNYPNNPTGAVCPFALFEEAVALARRYGFLVCHDAAYSRVTFDGYRPPSILQVPGALDAAVEFNSLSKSFNMAGWRLGVLAGSPDAVAALRLLKAQSESGQFLPVIHADINALSTSESWIEQRNCEIQQRRDTLVSTLDALPGLEVQAPGAGLYLWIRLQGSTDDKTYCRELMDDTGICIAPGSIYGQHGVGFVRVSLVASLHDLNEVTHRWQQWEDARWQ